MQASESDGMTARIRQLSRRLLEAQEVTRVIGYEVEAEGAVRPLVIAAPDEADRLVWNDRCVHNLATFLKNPRDEETGRVAIVAKGCDVKTIIALMQEGQVVREEIHVIGVDCAGQRDAEGTVIQKCTSCQEHRPPLYDTLVADEAVDVQTLDVAHRDYADVEEVEQLAVTERRHFWRTEAAKCLRCYACREACPLCYCVECFTDQTLPQYVAASPSINSNFQWLLLRALDLAGRCTGCMECDRVCPVDIPLHLLHRKAIKDVAALFGYEAGRHPTAKPLFTVFSEDDPDEDIR